MDDNHHAAVGERRLEMKGAERRGAAGTGL
jgi:hypothetical protein